MMSIMVLFIITLANLKKTVLLDVLIKKKFCETHTHKKTTFFTMVENRLTGKFYPTHRKCPLRPPK